MELTVCFCSRTAVQRYPDEAVLRSELKVVRKTCLFAQEEEILSLLGMPVSGSFRFLFHLFSIFFRVSCDLSRLFSLFQICRA